MVIIIGSNGFIGKRIIAHLGFQNVIALDKHIYENWWKTDAVDKIAHFFDFWGNEEVVVFVAVGVLNPSISFSEHDRVNHWLLRNIVVGASKAHVRVITFGTVMETLPLQRECKNHYIQSKIRFSDFFENFFITCQLPLHIRLHTLYGGESPPHSFMFLGQMFQAINHHQIFKMSSGTQMREYHHIDDDVKAIIRLMKLGVNHTVEINHGKAVTLRSMAIEVFEALNCLELLQIGSLSQPNIENYNIEFKSSALLTDMQFRESVPGITEYFNDCLALRTVYDSKE